MTPTAFLDHQRSARSGDLQDVAHTPAHGPAKIGFLRRLVVSDRGSRLLILSCLVMTIMAFSYAHKLEQLQAQLEFRKLTMSSVGSINLRLGNYAQVLTGTAAYVQVSPDMSMSGFEAYVAGLDLDRTAAGMVGVGFIRAERAPVMADDPVGAGHIASHEKEKMIVTHMAPQALQSGMVGLDKGFERVRRAALELARDNHETVLVRRSPGTQEDIGPAEFLMVRAVYGASGGVQNPEAFLGWVIAPFGAQNTLAGVTAHFGVDYELSVYQGTQVDPADVLFFSNDARGAFTQLYPIEQYGSTWLLRFVSTPEFDAIYVSYLPHMLLLLGLLFTVLVRAALRSAAQRHRALKALAELRMRQLGAREEENRALLETNVSVVMVLDGEARVVFANEAAAVLFAIPRTDFVGQPFAKFVRLRGSDEACDIANAEGLLSCGAQLMLDVQTNTWRTAEDLEQTTVLIRDVTDQITGRRAIEAVHQRYDIALTGAGIGIFEIDLLTGQSEMSETWHRIMATDSLEGAFDHRKHFIERVHPDDLPALLDADRRCIMGEAPRSAAEYRVKFGEQWRWMFSDAVPSAHSDDGHATGLIGTQSDITDLRHARNALELSEARFRMVLEDAPVGMAVMDDTGTFIGVNAALSTLSGYHVDALDQRMRLSHLLARGDFVKLSRDVRELHKSDQSKTYQNQFRLRTRSGEVRWGLFNISWTFDKNRNENVYIAQIIDITDQKRIEKIKSEFVATVSHELRTPLTSIKGALGLLDVTTRAVIPDNAGRLLDIATLNVDRLTGMVNDILDLERISSGDVVFEFEDVHLDELVAQTISEVEPVAAEHRNRLEMAMVDTGILVHVDSGRLRQVLHNLLTNACKFSDPDTVVNVRYEAGEKDVVVYVENIGTPVPESFHAQIFGAFTQVDGSDTRHRGGTGLGLNIARQIVMRLGGKIGFEQHPGRRTVFWFTCPVAMAESFAVVPAEKVAG